MIRTCVSISTGGGGGVQRTIINRFGTFNYVSVVCTWVCMPCCIVSVGGWWVWFTQRAVMIYAILRVLWYSYYAHAASKYYSNVSQVYLVCGCYTLETERWYAVDIMVWDRWPLLQVFHVLCCRVCAVCVLSGPVYTIFSIVAYWWWYSSMGVNVCVHNRQRGFHWGARTDGSEMYYCIVFLSYL